MKKTMGTLYGIGVGPGDPELVPVKSVRVLKQVDTVYAASSSKNTYSLAVDIVRNYIPAGTPVRMLPFPMTRDDSKKQAAWRDNAQIILDTLNAGKDAAFVTLGDPMTYSTYGYIVKNLQQLAPTAPIMTIPGITSYHAAAACTNSPLVEGEESLVILSGAKGGGHLRQLNGKTETVVILKAYKHIEDIADAIEASGEIVNYVCVKKCGLPDEEIVTDIRQLCCAPPDYWTLIIAKKRAKDEP
jgi:precorrin-2/cobalt-factor-2 C20-methyltransferase